LLSPVILSLNIFRAFISPNPEKRFSNSFVYQEPSTNIYIKPLSIYVTEDEFANLFSGFGEIKALKILRDRITGESKQAGFVRFETQESATKAVEKMNGYKLSPLGPPLIVKYAESDIERVTRKAACHPSHRSNSYPSATIYDNTEFCADDFRSNSYPSATIYDNTEFCADDFRSNSYPSATNYDNTAFCDFRSNSYPGAIYYDNTMLYYPCSGYVPTTHFYPAYCSPYSYVAPYFFKSRTPFSPQKMAQN